jgi:hypothetical protein
VTYRLQYRAINLIGNSDWSDIAYITAATVPDAPNAPAYTTADSTQIILSLSETLNNGGLTISEYKLYVNEGVDGSNYNQITAYDGSSLTYTMTVGDVVGGHTVFVGGIYSFYTVAVNTLGDSDDSDILQVVVDDMAATPADPTVSDEVSSES